MDVTLRAAREQQRPQHPNHDQTSVHRTDTDTGYRNSNRSQSDRINVTFMPIIVMSTRSPFAPLVALYLCLFLYFSVLLISVILFTHANLWRTALLLLFRHTVPYPNGSPRANLSVPSLSAHVRRIDESRTTGSGLFALVSFTISNNDASHTACLHHHFGRKRATETDGTRLTHSVGGLLSIHKPWAKCDPHLHTHTHIHTLFRLSGPKP